jgi:hypothetical protein
VNRAPNDAVNSVSNPIAASRFSDIAYFGKDSDHELMKSNEQVWAYTDACDRKAQTDIPCGAA